MTCLPWILRKVFSSAWSRRIAHRVFMRAAAPSAEAAAKVEPLRVLVLGVYLADRPNTACHLIRAFDDIRGIQVEQRWLAVGAEPEDSELRRVTIAVERKRTAKFALINRLIGGVDLDGFDYVLVIDDDIHLQAGFLPAFLALQRTFGFALAQPARAWHSHFDHAFVLRRPWLTARQTRFVECGPLVSFSREAVRLLLPFHAENEMWGMDLVWPVAIEGAGLTMGIIDALSIDHSFRAQATTYDRASELAAMSAFLARTPHVPRSEVFKVIRRYPARWRARYF